VAAALAFVVAACAAPGTTPAGPVAANAASTTTFVARVATSNVSYVEADATFVPLHAVATASGAKLRANDVTGRSVALVTAATAFAGIRKDISATTAGDLAGPIVASLYYYYNSAYGQILPGGKVKLKYQGTPVWLFTAPLVRSINLVVGRPGGVLPPVRTGCSFMVIVDASSGSWLTFFEHCPGETHSS